MRKIELQTMENEVLIERYSNACAQYAFKMTKTAAKVMNQYEAEIMERLTIAARLKEEAKNHDQ